MSTIATLRTVFVADTGGAVSSVAGLERQIRAGETDINSCSIGIEIVNPGHDYGYPDYPAGQIAAVTALCRGILTRFTIPAERVLAHSDVAPSRKQDISSAKCARCNESRR